MGGMAASFDSPVSVNGSTTTAFLSAAECKSPARPKRPIAKKNKESAAKRNFMRSSFASDAKRNPIPLRVSAAKKKYFHSEGIRRGCPKNLNRRNPKRFADGTVLESSRSLCCRLNATLRQSKTGKPAQALCKVRFGL